MARRRGKHHRAGAKNSLVEILGVAGGAAWSATGGNGVSLMSAFTNPELAADHLVQGITGIDIQHSVNSGKLETNLPYLGTFWGPVIGAIVLSKVMRHFRINARLSKNWKLF